MNAEKLFTKFFSALRIKSVVGGLEISDSAIKFVCFESQKWKMAGLRLPPGILEGGKIKNREKFVVALKNLRDHLPISVGRRERVNVIVVLNSVNVYSQVFNLPLLEGENLNQAIELNIQMISPVELSQAYSGWQLINQDQNALYLEILSAFISREIVDEVGLALKEGGFFPVAVESRAFSLARLVREQAINYDAKNPYFILNLDNNGLDILIIRRGQLYFEYFTSWKDIQNDKGKISFAALEAVILRNLHQIMNFYSKHWSEPVAGIFISVAGGLSNEVKGVIESNFSLKVIELKLKNGLEITPDWFIALGAALRGLKSRRDDKEVNLLGIGVEEEFVREQVSAFLRFWRFLVPVSFGVFLVIFFLVDFYLLDMQRSLEAQSSLKLSPEQLNEISLLEREVGEFNHFVDLIKSAKEDSLYHSFILAKIVNLMEENELTLSRFYIQSFNAPVILNGSAKSEEQILNFKKALAKESEISNIDLPLTAIQSSPEGVSFSMRFSISPEAFKRAE